jgi:hypothetical protein
MFFKNKNKIREAYSLSGCRENAGKKEKKKKKKNPVFSADSAGQPIGNLSINYSHLVHKSLCDIPKKYFKISLQ